MTTEPTEPTDMTTNTDTERPPLPPLQQCPDRKSVGGCADDGDGCCLYCGVSLSECFTCHGVGYHLDGCAEFVQ